MGWKKICNLIEKIDPKTELSVLRNDLTIKWANKAHLDRLGLELNQIKDRVCYELTNHFSTPCEWCPTKKTLIDKRIHQAKVCSPEGSNIKSSNILSLPIFGPKEKISEIVEIITSNDEKETLDLKKRFQKYHNIFDFGRIMEEIEAENHIPVFLLVGVVSEKCLAFKKADIFVLEEEANQKNLFVNRIGRLASCRSFNKVIRMLNKRSSRMYLNSYRLQLEDSCVKWEKFSDKEKPLLNDIIAKLYGMNTRSVANIIKSSQMSVRLSPNCVATLISGGKYKYFIVGQIMGSGHDLAPNQYLLDIGIYGLMIQQAIKNRKFSRDVEYVLKNCEEFLEETKKDSGAMIFASSIVTSFAHDLKESCGNLKGHLYDIWSKLGESKQKELLYAYEAARRENLFIKECMDRAIDIARFERISKKDFEVYDLHQLFRQIENEFLNRFKKNRISQKFLLKAPNRMVLCDKLFIKQVLSNLISNACASLIRTTHRNKELTVRTLNKGENFVFIVEDNGWGINPILKEKIWKPFYTTKKKGKGTGLGLMICRRIVCDIHNGDINVASRHGIGATFTVSLPCF